MSNGWIKLHRQTLNNPIVMKSPDHLAVWMWLLLNATHSDYDIDYEGKRITLKAGQLTTGRKVISKDLKINECKVQRILKTFEIEQQIEQQTNPRCRLISIVKWSDYQIDEQQIDQQVNNKRTLNNKTKKKKKIVYSDKFLELYHKYPKQVGKEMAQTRYKQALQYISHDELKNILVKHINYWDKVGKEIQFIPHLSTWLNKKRYEDELVANDGKVFNKPKSFVYECYICGDEKTLSREIDASERYHEGCGGDYEVQGSVILTNLKAKHNKPKEQDDTERIKKEKQLEQKSQLSDIAMGLVGEYKA